MFEKIIAVATDKTAHYLNWNEIETAEFYLGLQVLVHDTIMILGIALISFCMGILKESCIVFLSFGILRLKTGGIHCRENWQCFLSTTAIVIGTVLLAHKVEALNDGQIIMIYLALCLIVYVISPQGTKKRPILTGQQKRLRKEAVIVLLIEMVLSLVFKDRLSGLLTFAAIFEISLFVLLYIVNQFTKVEVVQS
ncbi:MAG: accessory gene regulator B family protein [Lachnospiraceae bacterium]|nr:accessory gene regulator B family protein [Lachnospiraceae bacterium]